MSEKMLKIRTTAGMVRRYGCDFYEQAREFPISFFKPHQLESLKDDPVLIVEKVEVKKLPIEGKYEQEGYV